MCKIKFVAARRFLTGFFRIFSKRETERREWRIRDFAPCRQGEHRYFDDRLRASEVSVWGTFSDPSPKPHRLDMRFRQDHGLLTF